MHQPPGILLLDDGELDAVARLLDELQLPFCRLRGGEIADELAPPSDLLIATPRHAQVVRRGSPQGAGPGRPVRIVAAPEDSTAMRRSLRRMGYHLLVRLRSHSSIWRLLIRRAIYQGDERRVDERVTVGSPVSLAADQSEQAAVLMDVSNRGCRLHSGTPFSLGAQLSLEVPASTTGDEPLLLRGSLVRVAGRIAADGGETHTAAMVFDEHPSESQLVRLASLINRWSLGPSSIASVQSDAPELPACQSAAIPGLTLDDETDPAIRVGEQVALRIAPVTKPAPGVGHERRSHARGAYTGSVVAVGSEGSRVLMGRDLSAGGMRVERLPDLRLGDRLRLALYGPARSEPFVLSARVIRDDGEDGLALGFEGLPVATAEALDKLVACLPDVESLTEGEARGLGAVISEILDEGPEPEQDLVDEG